ncbi:MAG: hypothetical protein J6Y77_06620 [Paludibacteraceae bacterium]|nr:hypothetical protein [Paludibacteraceae bacterium]
MSRLPLSLTAVAVLALVVQARAEVPDELHPEIGECVELADGKFSLTLESRKQNYRPEETATADSDIYSPKSVNIHPDGSKYYVNSLEGAKTVVYQTATNKKLKVIRHTYGAHDSLLWSPASGYFEFTHYTENLNEFYGKPVESVFTHQGRYLWIPFYRRSYDINAQDPSALAVIDTEKDEVVRLMETGPLPKMIAVSPDNHYLAVTHWGDNTVGIIDVSCDSIADWHYVACVEIGRKLHLNYSLTEPVNRDVNSGYCLRGTAFTPDGRYLLVGCMSRGGGIAVVDMNDFSWLGIVGGMRSNVRHLIIRNGFLYLSANASGYIQRVPLEVFLEAARTMQDRQARVDSWVECQVGKGARTIEMTPDGCYVVAACNFSSSLWLVDADSMRVVATIEADSYPVGLDISKDGRYIYTTSQGRSGRGGNCVDIYRLDAQPPVPPSNDSDLQD